MASRGELERRIRAAECSLADLRFELENIDATAIKLTIYPTDIWRDMPGHPLQYMARGTDSPGTLWIRSKLDG